MRRIKLLIAALFILSNVSVQAADFVEVSKSITVNAELSKVWEKVGDFCAIQEWHPVVENCKAYDDHGTFYRALTLGDGGTILEKRKSEEANSYTYFIKKSPLPVKAYKATFKAEADGDKTTITWESRFKSKDATDEEAKATIEGIFDGGLESIKGMF